MLRYYLTCCYTGWVALFSVEGSGSGHTLFTPPPYHHHTLKPSVLRGTCNISQSLMLMPFIINSSFQKCITTTNSWNISSYFIIKTISWMQNTVLVNKYVFWNSDFLCHYNFVMIMLLLFQRTMMTLLFSIGIFSQVCDSDVKCRDDSGNEVDWLVEMYSYKHAPTQLKI